MLRLIFLGSTAFYINYEECKFFRKFGGINMFKGFILTMRNVNSPVGDI